MCNLKYAIIACCLLSGLYSIPVLANDDANGNNITDTVKNAVSNAANAVTPDNNIADTVRFLPLEQEGKFYCTADSSVTGDVTLIAKDVSILGFCADNGSGNPDGVVKMSAADLNKYYFQVKKKIHKVGKVEIQGVPSGITCKRGNKDEDTNNRTLFGSDNPKAGYCPKLDNN